MQQRFSSRQPPGYLLLHQQLVLESVLVVVTFLILMIWNADGLMHVLKNETHGCIPNQEICNENNIKTYTFNRRDLTLISSNLVDNRKKILMAWSQKAACTTSVKSFMAHMGFYEGADFIGWVHDFRESEFWRRCGTGTICMYEDSSWYRFKVVRNPYDRAVSSYIHVMHYDAVPTSYLLTTLPHLEDKYDCTFKDFVRFMELRIVASKEKRLVDGGHVRKQSYDMEYIRWSEGQSSPFHRIVKIENFAEDIALVNRETGANFSAGFGSIHYAKRQSEEGFVGDVAWKFLHNRIPKSYGYFYDSELRERVMRIFHVDLLLYNYDYPF